ncbi:MAG: DNA repair protein RadA [Synergistaceae bacterium]|nr:DNA repair protein RadA [Synergistaceae bacterium]
MAKKPGEKRFRCAECGFFALTWSGKCPACGSWGTFEEERRDGASLSLSPKTAPIVAGLSDLEPPRRIPSGIDELDRVIGGGWVAGSVALLAGEPGVGKSTLLLQTCAAISRAGSRVLYVSGEEAASQVALRGKRLGAADSGVSLLCQESVQEILPMLHDFDFAVFDSVQALRHTETPGWPGTPGQVRAVAQVISEEAKKSGCASVLVGHITKDGQIAGPKLLEHMVDVVLHFSGDRTSPYRHVRGVKNRYGSTDELGVFEMAEEGLVGIPDPSRLYWNENAGAIPGTAMTVVLEGSRPLVAEIQSLSCTTPFPYPKRTARGVAVSRMGLLLAVLERRGGLPSRSMDVFMNVVGGLHIEDPAADLAVCMSLASSLSDLPLPRDMVFIGEVGLGGEVRPVPRLVTRIRESARLGFSTVVTSRYQDPQGPEGVRIVKVGSLGEAMKELTRGC